MPILADGVNHGNAVLLSHGQVVHTVGRRDVHNAGAGFRGDEIGWQHAEDICFHLQVLEQLLVAHTDKLSAFSLADDLVFEIPQNLPAQGIGED